MKTRSQTRAEAAFAVATTSPTVKKVVKQTVKPRIKRKAASVVKERQIYEVDIDFDGASEAWNMNKKRLPNGCYEYVCEAITRTGKKCCRKAIFASEYCLGHSKMENNK